MKSHFRPETIRPSIRRGGWVLFCLLFPITLALSAPGQKKEKPMVHQAPYKVGFWRPWNQAPWPPLTAHFRDSKGNVPPYTGVQARVFLEKIAGIAGVFRKVPALNPPLGLEILPHRFLYDSSEVPGPIPGRLGITLIDYWTMCDTCKVGLDPEPSGIDVQINFPEGVYGGRPYLEDERGPMYRVPNLVGHVAGFAEYDTGVIILTKIKRPLWVPVSQERFLRHEIRDFRSRLKTSEDTIAKGSAYQQWIAESAQRRRDREEAYRELKQMDPKAAEALRTRLENAEKEAGEKLKSSEAGDAAMLGKGMESLRDHIRAMEDELASLSPAARSSPAYYMIGGMSPRPSGLADAGAQGAEMIVETNRDFFDRGKPVTSIQLMAVRGFLRAEEALKNCEEMMKERHLPRHVEGATTLVDFCFLDEKFAVLRRTLDWNLLASLLDENTADTSTTGRVP